MEVQNHIDQDLIEQIADFLLGTPASLSHATQKFLGGEEELLTQEQRAAIEQRVKQCAECSFWFPAEDLKILSFCTRCG